MLGGSGLVKHEILDNLILFLQSGEILLANLLSSQSTFIPTNFASVSSASPIYRLAEQEGCTDKDRVSLSLRQEMNITS